MPDAHSNIGLQMNQWPLDLSNLKDIIHGPHIISVRKEHFIPDAHEKEKVRVPIQQMQIPINKVQARCWSRSFERTNSSNWDEVCRG